MTTADPASAERWIVVGVDGSPGCRPALLWAAHLAAVFDARLDAVMAWENSAGYGMAAVPLEWNPGEEMTKVLRSTVSEVLGEHPSVRLHLHVQEGGAARVLLEAGSGATMVVVGSRGHGGFLGMVLGSVSRSVAEHALCPVVIVHGDQPPPGRTV